MGQTRNPSRPKLTDDLVQRLESRDTSPEEATALQALSKQMIKVFKDHPDPSYVREATALASVVTAKDYPDLFHAFVDGAGGKDHPEYLVGLKTITKIFKDRPSEVKAVATLSAVNVQDPPDLFMTFLNAIIVEGNQNNDNIDRKLSKRFKDLVETISAAGHSSSIPKAAVLSFLESVNSNLDPTLLIRLVFALNLTEGSKWAPMRLGPLLNRLQKRLDEAVEQSEVETQYQLVCTLSIVLDVMADKKTTGISRLKLHDPLLKQLNHLSENQELRLARAAGYAYQALLSIPNDEGPYKALWRHARTVADGALKLASAVSAMDPSKILEGAEKLSELPELINSFVEAAKDLYTLYNDLGDAVPREKHWYAALRCTEFLLQANAFDHLKAFVEKVPCRQEKDFLCNMYAQLEQAWEAGQPPRKEKIVQFLQDILVPMGSRSKHRRVHGWVKLVADTLGRPDWKDKVPPAQRRGLARNNKYTSTITGQKMGHETYGGDLLNTGWKPCVEAQVFYADIKVREHYLQNSGLLLKVERLSGDPLPMDQCYINLAIVEQSGRNGGRSEEGDMEHKSSPFSLLARLKVETPYQDNQVSLPSLFSPRKRPDGTVAPPQRILIRGQAGVGKTTLCKRIVYNYLHEGMWAGMFDRLLWVPLRTLKGRSTPEYNLTLWLRDEYFRDEDGDIFAKALTQTGHDLDKRGRTLFILDGLDEVSRDLDSGTPGPLQDLLKQPHVIITSRPSGVNRSHIGRIDLELETVGFYLDQVEAYIKTAVPDQAGEIQSFLQDRWLLQGLVRIPIQLEALCYSWDATVDAEGVTTTMTTLYQAIESKLWKKDTARLGKPHEGIPLSEATAKSILYNEIASQVIPEVHLLRCLAFTGLYNDVIEFDKKSQEEIWKHWNDILKHLKPATSSPSSLALAKLSFLRSSDIWSDEKNRSYHFLHLTYQEFFAAQYFVEHWKSDKPLSCLELSSGRIEGISTKDFLREEKYKAPYDIFWRFAAGLLQDDHDKDQLYPFFDAIEDEPRDLLGPTHQRLVMHCLSEVVPSKEMSDFTQLRRNLEDQLSRWLLFECDGRYSSRLACEMELPEHVLNDVLKQGSEDVKVKVLKSLEDRSKIPLSIIGLATSWLGDNVSPSLRAAILHMLRRPNEDLPERTLEAIAARLEDSDSYVRREAVEAIGGQSALSSEVLEAVATRLEDSDSFVRRAAVEALGGQPALSSEVIKAIAARLEHSSKYVRREAVEALGGQPALPTEVLEAIATRLEDSYSYVRRAAVEALGRQPALPTEVLEAIAARLEHSDKYVRGVAVAALGRQPALSSEVLKAIAARLEHLVWYIRGAAVEVLGRQPALPSEVLEAIAARLEDSVGYVRGAAVEALGGQPALSSGVLKAIAARLKHSDSYVRRAAVEVLRGQLAIPSDVLKAVAARLEDSDMDVRGAAAEALGSQPAWPSEILDRYLKPLYAIWLNRSFGEHLSCWVADEMYIDIPEGFKKIHFEGQQDQFRDRIREIQKDFGIPRTSSMVSPAIVA